MTRWPRHHLRGRLLIAVLSAAIAAHWCLGLSWSVLVPLAVLWCVALIIVASSSTYAVPPCPQCGGRMRRRLNRVNPLRPTEFLGCAHYPACKGTRELSG